MSELQDRIVRGRPTPSWWRLVGGAAVTDLSDPVDLDTALSVLEHAVGLVQTASLDGVSPKEELALVGRFEVLRRRLDHGTDLAAGHLDRSGAFSRCHTLDGSQVRPAEAVDHRHPAGREGPTDVTNSDAYCGFHNRIKERGFRPIRNPDGTWTIHRPHGQGPITPPT